MLYKQRTRKIFLTFVLFSILLVTSFVSIDTLFFFNKTKEVTINNAISKNKEREEVIKKFILNSKDILKALRNSKEFKKYLLSKSKENEQELESLFLTFARSQGSFMQLRYIDKSGMEKVRVDRESENDLALLVPKNRLQNKKNRYYFKESLSINLEKIWFSKLDLNIENNQVQMPYKPTLRAIFPIKNGNNFDGIIIVNYFMENFLKELLNISLYNAILINEKGYSLVHYNSNKSWGFYKKNKFHIRNEFPNDFKNIINKESFLFDTFASKKLDVPVKDGLILILKLKESYANKEEKQRLFRYIIVSTITFLLSLILSIIIVRRFSKVFTELEDEKERLKTIFNTSLEGLAILNLETQYLYFNKAYTDMLGYSKEELKQKKCLDLTAPEFQKRSLEIYEKVLKDGHYANFERKCITKSGKVKILNSSITLMPRKDTYLLTTVDNTKLREKDKEIEEQNKILAIQSKMKSIGALLINISHHWRQPLSLITSVISGLKLKYDFDTIRKEDIEQANKAIIKNVNLLSQTIEDIKDFIEGDYSFEKFELNELIKNCLEYYTLSYNKLNIKVNIDYENSIELYNSKDGLFQSIINILSNAEDILSKKEDKNRFVFINVFDNKKLVSIEIYDNGGGVDEANLNTIFDPYFTTHHQTYGKGMGLSIVHNIVNKHLKGTIVVKNINFTYNNKAYKGARFKISIPKNLNNM